MEIKGGFKRTLWMQIGPLAYEGFLKYGRGGILIRIAEVDVTEGDEGNVQLKQKAQYIPMDHPDNQEGMKDFFEKYDPETEIVLMQLTDNGIELSIIREPELPSPKTLYQRAHN